jgi:outer membrane protein OmpA-like peptidoglycan-associated protein
MNIVRFTKSLRRPARPAWVMALLLVGLGTVGTAQAQGQAGPPELRNLGEPVNTPLDEFSPSVTADGRTMVFNSKRLGERYQSLYLSSRGDDGRWSTPQPIAELNSIYNDEAPYITPDGMLIFFASDRDGSQEMPADAAGRVKVSFDIYWARKDPEKGGWSMPLPVPGAVNTPHHERSPALDLRTGQLFFARWPFGDFEQSRIFAARYEGGRFNQAEALPDSVNAGYQEAAFVPALDRDSGYYFASRRPDGHGGWDIYYIAVEQGKYGTPENLGLRVNSAANDIYYSVREGAGFLSSDREDGLGRYDIYGVAAAPETVVFEVRDAKTGQRLAVTATVTRGSEPETRQTGADGRFRLKSRPQGDRAVTIRIQQQGYLPFERDYDLARRANPSAPASSGQTGPTAATEAVELIELAPLERDASFDMHAIHFDANEAVIRADSFGALDRLADYLRQNSGLRLEIIGHTDLHGTPDYNMDLSLRRARAVRDYLVGKGLAAERFQVKGAGLTRPVIDKIGEGFDERNRRTEFRIIGLE